MERNKNIKFNYDLRSFNTFFSFSYYASEIFSNRTKTICNQSINQLNPNTSVQAIGSSRCGYCLSWLNFWVVDLDMMCESHFPGVHFKSAYMKLFSCRILERDKRIPSWNCDRTVTIDIKFVTFISSCFWKHLTVLCTYLKHFRNAKTAILLFSVQPVHQFQRL